MPHTDIQQTNPGEFSLVGTLSIDTVLDLKDKGEALFLNQPSLAIDLSAVTHCDSIGLVLLIGWLRFAQNKQLKIRYHTLPKQLMAMATIYGLDDILPIRKK